MRLAGKTTIESHAAMMARWIFDSGADFFVALFGDPTVARRDLQSWVCRNNSEFSALSTILGVDQAIPVGMILALPGGDTFERRRADLKVLIKAATAEHRATLKMHLHTFADCTAPVSEDDFYVCTLTVDVQHRGRGYGRQLLQRALHDGIVAGFRRFRLDVQTDNQPAVALYRSLGFKVIREASVGEFGFAMYSMLLEK